MKRYELIDHTADMGLRIFGADTAELFRNAGYALFDVMTDLARVRPLERRRFRLQRDSLEELLVEWLNRLLYVFDTELILFCSFSIAGINNTSLDAEALGEHLNQDVHGLLHTVKAVTYHNLKITERGGIWEATLVIDL